MKKISEVSNEIRNNLHWILTVGAPQPLEYELRGGTDTFASLRYEKAGGTLATATSADGSWTFKRAGNFLHPEVTVRLPNQSNNLAVFRPNLSGDGPLEFTGGQPRFEWKHEGPFWNTSWGFEKTNGENIIFYRPALGSVQMVVSQEVTILQLSELSLLASFGWYLLVSMQDV